MATETVVQRPAPFVEKLGTNLAENVLAQQGVPIVTGGIGSISQLPGETPEQFQARTAAAQRFDIRKQSLAGLAPTVAGRDPLQTTAQDIATTAAGVGTAQQGLGTFQPFLTQAQDAATAAGTALGGVGTGATAFQQEVGQFMSPYQTQVIDATLAEFDRNRQIQEQSIRDQQAKLGVLGAGRAGVQLAEFGTGAARERALLQAGLLGQGFQQAAAARQQDIGNLGALASQQLQLGQFQSGLGGQASGIVGTNIGRLGQLGALNQAQRQAELDAQREATRMAAFQPQEELNRFADITTGIMGGMRGQGTTTTNIPNPTPLQTALGVGSTLAGIYGAFNPRPLFG